MRIPPELAETLAAIVDAGTMDAAAASLGITQPAVSQRLRTLEGLVGQVLLVRSRPPRLTDAGQAVVRFARQFAHLEADAVAALGVGEHGTHSSLPIAVNSDSLSTWLLPALHAVSERAPVVLELHRDDQDFTVGLLEAGTVLAAVTSRDAPIAGCRVTPLGVMRYQPMATAAFHERWFPGGVTADALERAPLVDYDRRDELQTRWLQRRRVDPSLPPRHRIPATHEYAEAVVSGLGWGQLLPFQAEQGLASGELVPLADDTVDVPLFWQQWNLRSRLLDLVAEEIVAQARRVLPAR